MSIESVMPFNHLILDCPLLFLPSILSSIRGFSSESALHIRWPGIGASTSTLVHIQGWFLSRSTGLSPCRPRDSKESTPAPQFEGINFLFLNLFYCPAFTSVHDYWKNQSFDNTDLCSKVMSLLFNMLSRFVTASTFSPAVCHEVMRLDAMIFIF